jgi:predicted peptidase
MTVPLYGQNLLTNPGFEDGNTTGWVAMGEYGLNVTDKQAHRGRYSIYCHDRTAYWQGPAQDLKSVLKHGHTYQISAWVRLDNAQSSYGKMTMQQIDGDGTNYHTIDEATVYNDRWVRFSGNFTPEIIGNLETMNLYVEGPIENVNFYVDDVVVVPEVKLQIQQLADGRTAIALRIEGIDEKVPDIPAKIQVLDIAGKELAGETSSIGSGQAFSLPPGFARVVVEIPDYCGERLELERLIIAGDAKKAIGQIVAQARKMQAKPKMADYTGWIDYLASQVEKGLAQGDTLSGKTVEVALKLTEWTTKIAADANTLSKLRGMQEWAYLSKVDDTGQPFLIAIPDDYDHKRSYPLYLELHGRTQTHMLFSTFESAESDRVKLFVLGRSRAGNYIALSEVDVLEALDYVMKNWNIDPDHVHLTGISMGGFGTFSMTSRFPDLFASAVPKCGGGAHVPIENALHVPFYALHSEDDYVVPVSHSRIATRTIEKFGGLSIQDETNGIGHAISRYREGFTRARKWADGLVRKKKVDRVHYTAMDELARKAYWVELLEWGPQGRPAEIDARIGSNNTLYITLDNVGVLKIDLKSCPAEKQMSLTVVVNRRIEKTIEAPLPDALYIISQKDGWLVTKDKPKSPHQRLHFPGGAMALYHGEPIMIVWGTGGDEQTNKRIYDVAQISRRLCRPGWPGLKELRDGVPMVYTLYGRLPGKPDSEVTQADMEKYNLFLIGTAKQNSVVAKLSRGLPVKIEDGRVGTNDGFSWDFKDRALGLLFYNPLAPKRLVYWVASESADFYQIDSPMMESQYWHPDFLVMHATEEQFIAARWFDSRWVWEKSYADSPLMKKELCSKIGHDKNVAKILRQKTGADFTLYGTLWQSDEQAFSLGQSRRMDMLALRYYERIAMMELSGQEILDDIKSFSKALDTAVAKKKANQEKAKEKGQKLEDEAIGFLRFFPEPKPESIDPHKLYSVVAFVWEVHSYVETTQKNPENLRHLAVTMRDVLNQ